MDANLTICTVSYGHSEHIAMNIALMRQLNGNQAIDPIWKVADNAHDDDKLRFVDRYNCVQAIKGSLDRSRGISVNHADALDMLIADVNTRFLLVLDPDFYLLGDNWIQDVVTHMQDQRISVFGAPWHPRYNRNYRYFPAVHCMFIDLSRVAKQRLDFMPLPDRVDSPQPPRSRWYDRVPMLAKRRRVPWDTGTRIYEEMVADPSLKTEYAIQTFRPHNPHPLKTRLMQALLPDEYCYFPKKRSSYTLSGFHERGLLSAPVPEIWEELYWQDRPFGLHVRGNYNREIRDQNAELELLAEVLSELTRGRGRTIAGEA